MYVNLLLKQFWHLVVNHNHCDCYQLSDTVTVLPFFFFLVLLGGFSISVQCYLNCFQNKILVTESVEKVDDFVVWFSPNNKVALPTIIVKSWPLPYFVTKSPIPYHQHPP